MNSLICVDTNVMKKATMTSDIVSELTTNGYDSAVFCDAILEAISFAFASAPSKDSDACFDAPEKSVFSLLLKSLNSSSCKLELCAPDIAESFSKKISLLKEIITDIPPDSLNARTDADDELNIQKGDSNSIITPCDRIEFLNRYFDLLDQNKTSKSFYDKEISQIYLDTFFKLFQTTVFNPNNINLSNSLFRNSSYLNTVISSFAIKQNIKRQRDVVGDERQLPSFFYEFAFLDPFAYDTVSRALQCAEKLIEDARNDQRRYTKLIFELRKNLLVSSVESAFCRRITLDRTTYVLNLNRHTSKLIAYPTMLLSSTSDMKTIRLFEKTASYIRNNLDHAERELTISITIIGHAEISRGEKESSLSDYVMAILQWYNGLSERINGKRKPKLTLEVKNIYSRFDYCEAIGLERKHFSCNYMGSKAFVSFEKVDFEKTFAFSLKTLKSYISKSQILFLLDCPWLSTDNYTIGEGGSIGNYSKKLQQINRNMPSATAHFEKNSKFFYSASAMHELSDQLNRFMSSTSLNAGTVIRTMRDDYIREIQKVLESKKCTAMNNLPTEFYIFSSENDGIGYSYVDSYPLTRIEQYDGKRFTILHFSNQKKPMLVCGETGVICFTVNLWSILKYLCIPFAFRDIIDEFFVKNGVGYETNWKESKKLELPIQYLELLRGILVDFCVEDNMSEIHVALHVSKSFVRIIESCVTDAAQTTKSILQDVLLFLKPLFKDSVFSIDSQYGDDAIKQGFRMVLYSAAKDANTMLFYHLYEKSCRLGDFSKYTIEFEELEESSLLKDGYCDAEFSNGYFFADKKIYAALLDIFEQDYRLNLNMIAMLREAEDLYIRKNDSNSVARIIIGNIESACRKAHLEKTRLYGNVQLALKQLNI